MRKRLWHFLPAKPRRPKQLLIKEGTWKLRNCLFTETYIVLFSSSVYIHVLVTDTPPTRFRIAVFITSSYYGHRINFIAHDLLKNKQAGDVTHTANFTYIYSSSFCELTSKQLAPHTRRADLISDVERNPFYIYLSVFINCVV